VACRCGGRSGGDRLLAASAYLEEDKCGKRVLECLNANDGSTMWETPLDLNPWGGPTIAGDLVIVACSNIRFDRKLLGEAKGQVVGVELATGKIRWKKDVAGGVLSPAAVSGDLAVFTATDGRSMRSTPPPAPIDGSMTPRLHFSPAGNRRWRCVRADLKGGVHALQMFDGKVVWNFDVCADPASDRRLWSSLTRHSRR